MKRPSVVVAVTGLAGLVMGVVLGLITAAGSSCEADFVAEGDTCYRYFGQFFSDTTYYSVNGGFWGLVLGLGLGLFIVTGRWLTRRRHDVASN